MHTLLLALHSKMINTKLRVNASNKQLKFYLWISGLGFEVKSLTCTRKANGCRVSTLVVVQNDYKA